MEEVGWGRLVNEFIISLRHSRQRHLLSVLSRTSEVGETPKREGLTP